jgi:hypothetical protein
VKLNEWNFAIYVLETLKSSEKVEFTIIKRFDNNYAITFEGLLKDQNENEYLIDYPENSQLFDELMSKHKLDIEEGNSETMYLAVGKNIEIR